MLAIVVMDLVIPGSKFGRWTTLDSVDRGYVTCRCACGTPKRVFAHNLISGKSTSCGCYRKEVTRARSLGNKNPRWTGGRQVTKHGYVRVPVRGKKVFEHRVVMEKKLGRRLLPGETIHHLNGIRDDNRPKNLELWQKGHPAGKRVKDLIAWSIDILTAYAPEKLR